MVGGVIRGRHGDWEMWRCRPIMVGEGHAVLTVVVENDRVVGTAKRAAIGLGDEQRSRGLLGRLSSISAIGSIGAIGLLLCTLQLGPLGSQRSLIGRRLLSSQQGLKFGRLLSAALGLLLTELLL